VPEGCRDPCLSQSMREQVQQRFGPTKQKPLRSSGEPHRRVVCEWSQRAPQMNSQDGISVRAGHGVAEAAKRGGTVSYAARSYLRVSEWSLGLVTSLTNPPLAGAGGVSTGVYCASRWLTRPERLGVPTSRTGRDTVNQDHRPYRIVCFLRFGFPTTTPRLFAFRRFRVFL
jgi:hypothetical protein